MQTVRVNMTQTLNKNEHVEQIQCYINSNIIIIIIYIFSHNVAGLLFTSSKAIGNINYISDMRNV